MLMQNFKAALRFAGILLLRVFLGVVAGILWMQVLSFIARNTVGALHYRHMDRRYAELAETTWSILDPVQWYGAWAFLIAGIIWGVSQGRFDLRRLLRKRLA